MSRERRPKKRGGSSTNRGGSNNSGGSGGHAAPAHHHSNHNNSSNNSQHSNNNSHQKPNQRSYHSGSSRSNSNTQVDDFNQFFVGTSSLIAELDHRILVVVRENMVPSGKLLYGVLRSFDQFANLVLEDCVERAFVDQRYAEVRRGLYLVRGENVVFVGRLVRAHVRLLSPVCRSVRAQDPARAEVSETLQLVPWSDIVEARRRQRVERDPMNDE